jgi:3-hydroxybutyryl-CoA dehydrogenase
MEETIFNRKSILVIGNGKLAYSVYVCILNAGHKVVLYTEDYTGAVERIHQHLTDMNKAALDINCNDLKHIQLSNGTTKYDFIIIITAENLAEKKSFLQIAEQHISADTIIAINTESIALSALQQDAKSPQCIIGANWTEPAHTTLFLEIITNKNSPKEIVNEFCSFAKQSLNKDPFILKNDFGIRTRMMCAMIREAFYLVENGYVSVEDIDRACRNDAGYYLPFAGNFRYMDLMGTFVYGIVMKDLNPELSKDNTLPSFFKKIIQNSGEGMKNGHGFYEYQNGDTKKWDEAFRAFSYQIQKIIENYSSVKTEENIPATDLISLGS